MLKFFLAFFLIITLLASPELDHNSSKITHFISSENHAPETHYEVETAILKGVNDSGLIHNKALKKFEISNEYGANHYNQEVRNNTAFSNLAHSVQKLPASS